MSLAVEEVSHEPLRVWREHEGRVLRLRLDRPKANILDGAMIGALDAALGGAEADAKLIAVVLDAEGPHFCFGASVEEHLPARCAAMLAALNRLILRMAAYPVPIVVAVRGQCLGGGLELAAAGHLMMVAPDATLGQPEIRLGVIAPAASVLLPGRIGRAWAEDLLFSGRGIGGDAAARIGLANATAEDPTAAALDYVAGHYLPLSPSSLRFAVRAARPDAGLRAALQAASALYLDELMKTHDANEGLQAFLAKRPAQWEAR